MSVPRLQNATSTLLTSIDYVWALLRILVLGSAAIAGVAVLAMMGVLVDSFRWSRRGDIRWRGRSYPARAERRPA